MIKIEASVLSADFARLGEQAKEAEVAGVDSIQIDMMDGHFVPNLTFGAGVVKALRPLVRVPLSAHLMVTNPELYIKELAEAGADHIIVHQESCLHLHRNLQVIRELGVKAGISLNPATPLCVLEEVLDLADLIQVMTVNPGFGGQPFIYSQLEKIRRLSKMLAERGKDIPIIVDGGIDTTTAPLVVKAGATVLVAGSSIYNKKASVKENVAALRTSLK